MKNVSNPYGYYLTEDFETIELRGNFEENAIFLPTKNPDEQLIYKVFVSPKKAINFAIQIVGGTNPNVVYIPQHMYKDLQIAYNENNPYYTIKDVTIIKLDFTDTGNRLIKYLKEKFEKLNNGTSKLTSAGVSSVVNYAGFDESGNPLDEDIIKQILFLFEEQDDVIFVEKDDELVTEQIVNSKSLKSNRIKGDFNYTSNYFDGSGAFSSELLNSETNIKLESSTFSSVLQLNDFVKDFAGKSLSDVNAIYKGNIVKDVLISQAPKIAGLVLGGLQKALPLVKGLKDKVSQLKAQKAAKKAEELKTIGKGKLSSAKDQVTGTASGAKDSATEAVDSVKDIVKKPVVPQISNKVPEKVNVKPVENTYKPMELPFKWQTKAEADQEAIFQKAAGVGLSDKWEANSFGHRFYDDPIEDEQYNNELSRLKRKSIERAAEDSFLNVKADSKATSTKTISTIGNVSQAEGQQMLKNVGKSTPSSIKQINADFLKF